MTKSYPMKCHIRAEGGVTRVDVYDDIGDGSWFSEGLSAKAFAATLASVKGPLDVHINSYGGDVGDGLAITNGIHDHKGFKKTVVDGFACSIASVIAQAGDERVMKPGSMMMIHDALSWPGDVNAAEARELADLLDKHSNNIAKLYADRAGGTPQEWRDVMRQSAWYTAEEAVAAGLADRVGDGEAEIPAGFDVAAFERIPGRIAARLRSMPQAAAPRGDATGPCCDRCGPGCKCTEGSAQDRAAVLGAAAAAEEHGHPGRDCWDGDGDGDCDLTPEGDTDHDYWSEDGGQKRDVPGKPMDDALAEDRIRAIVRDELHVSNAAVDESDWDGDAAMAAAGASDDPEAAFRAICAGEHTTGEPDERQHWALPHHKHPGDPPNRHGVNNAMSRLSSTQDLKNRSATEAHLEAHQKAMGGGSDDHAHTDLSGISPEDIRAALKGLAE